MEGYALRWAEADTLLACAGVVRARDPITVFRFDLSPGF